MRDTVHSISLKIDIVFEVIFNYLNRCSYGKYLRSGNAKKKLLVRRERIV
jgi:hypothetical protein